MSRQEEVAAWAKEPGIREMLVEDASIAANQDAQERPHEHDWAVPLNDQGASPSCRVCGTRYDFGDGDD